MFSTFKVLESIDVKGLFCNSSHAVIPSPPPPITFNTLFSTFKVLESIDVKGLFCNSSQYDVLLLITDINPSLVIDNVLVSILIPPIISLDAIGNSYLLVTI